MAGSLGRAVQQVLLASYRGVRRTGVFATRPGRALFEAAYWNYKRFIEARDLDALRTYVAPGSTVIDVGANIGFFTVPFCQWVGNDGRVIAIEPERENFESLAARISRLGLGGIAVLRKAAAVEAPGRVNLLLNPDHPADHRVADHGMEVDAISVDSIVAELGDPPVSFIKIDVQGGETRVIRGARRTIERSHPVLFVEFQEESLVLAGTSSRELLGMLAAFGYIAHVSEAGTGWRPIAESELLGQVAAKGYVDALMLRRRGAMGPT